jgi:hypothetical protein
MTGDCSKRSFCQKKLDIDGFEILAVHDQTKQDAVMQITVIRELHSSFQAILDLRRISHSLAAVLKIIVERCDLDTRYHIVLPDDPAIVLIGIRRLRSILYEFS